jgi:hypothetical protein
MDPNIVQYIEKFDILHPSSVFIRMFKSRKMRWVSYAAQMWNTRTAYRVLVGQPNPSGLYDYSILIIIS